MLMLPGGIQALKTQDCSEDFIQELKAYDDCLNATRDVEANKIYVWAVRKGKQVHELTVQRNFGELWPEVERKTIKKLRDCDVWKNFKSADEFDDYLFDKENEHRQKLKAKNKQDRISRLKEDRYAFEAAVWNAQNGRLTRDQVLPYKIPSNAPTKGIGKPERVV